MTLNNCLNNRFRGEILKKAVLKEQFKVSCFEMHFLREEFWSSSMFCNVFWISDSRLLLVSVAFVKIYSHLCAPILIFFLSVRTYFHLCVLVWMLKHQKYWYSFCWKYCDINNFLTESWILSSQQYYDKIVNTNNILQLRTFKTQLTTNTGALVWHRLYGSVAEQISQTIINIFYLSWKEFRSGEEQ